VIFDSDASVRQLLEQEPEVIAAVKEAFGGDSVKDGRVDRGYLRGIVFGNEEARLKLEAILHPRVRQECLDLLAEAARNGAGMFLADIPLFFETGFDFGQDQVLVVACSRQSQVERLKARNGFDDPMIEA